MEKDIIRKRSTKEIQKKILKFVMISSILKLNRSKKADITDNIHTAMSIEKMTHRGMLFFCCKIIFSQFIMVMFLLKNFDYGLEYNL